MNLSKAQRLLFSASLSAFLVGCGAPNYSQSDMHMTIEEAKSTEATKPEKIPALVKASPTAPVLSSTEDSATFDVVVTSVPVRDLLFALARDAEINMDIDDQVGGYVSISAIDQTLDAILERVSRQVAIRIERVGDAMLVRPDTPYHKYYQIDFLNIARTFSSSASSTGVGDTGDATIDNTAESDFWTGLEDSIEQILSSISYDQVDAGGAETERGIRGDEAADQIADSEIRTAEFDNNFNLNPETGVLVVFAPDSLQREIQTLLDRSMTIAKRQVLLEATIVEVVLNNRYAQGIDWSVFNSLATEGLALYQGGAVGGAAAALEFLTSEIEYTFAEQEFNAAAYQDYTDSQLEGLGLTAAQIAAAPPPGTGTAEQIAVGEARRANYVARTLRDSYVDSARAQAYDSSGLNRVTEYEPTLSQEFDEDSGLFTYGGGVDYTREELNEGATSRSSGGLRPNNLQENFFSAAYREGDISAAVQLLDTFGDAKVLSSPRISVLNHQPALLRVVDQEVYFSFEVNEAVNEETGQISSREFTSEENIVDVGFSMNVLPQISAEGEVILNLKPAVTRIIDYRQAPIFEAFGSAAGGTQNFVPITRVRELESIISLRDGEIAVLGGLLEDRTGDNSSSVPGLSRLPGVGKLFEQKDETTFKTEFVVFIRARVISNPSINADYSSYRHLLPNSDFILRDTESTLLPPSQLKVR